MTLTPPEQVDPQSLAFANRASDLLAAQPWMDSQSAVTLAQQQTTNEQMHAQAQAMGDALAQSWNGYEQQFYDPILQAQPSAQQAATAHVFQTIGPPPATNGIVSLQAALKADGFLSADPTGVWDSETENAYNQAVNALKAQQYGGAPKKHGNPFTSTVSALYHSVIHDTTHPWDAAIGWYDSVRQAVGDIGGAVAGTGADAIHGFGLFGAGHGQQVFDRTSGQIVNALGGHTTTAQQHAIHGNPLNIAGDVLSVAGATSVARGVAKGVADQVAKSAAANLEAKAAEGTLTDAEALKFEKLGAAMSTAQRMGFIQRSINDIGDALRAGTLPADSPLVKRNLGVITKTLLKTPARIVGHGPTPAGFAVNAAGDAEQIFSKAWRDNLPGLARLAPVAQKLAAGADEGGWAYTIRNAIATPYRLAPVRALGVAAQRAELGSLAAHAAGGLLPGSQLQKNLDTAHTGFDSWLDNTTWNPIPGVSIGPEDFLLGPLHGDLAGAGRASRVIGSAMDNFLNGLNDTLGKTGVIAAFEHSTGLSYHDLLRSVGGNSVGLQTWMRNHQVTAAADAYVTRELGYNPRLANSAEEDAQIKTLRDQWYKLPEPQQNEFLADYAKADTHLQYLRNYLDSAFLRDSLSKDARAAATKTDLNTFIESSGLMQDFMHSGAANFIIGPNGAKALEDVPPWEMAGKPAGPGLPALFHGTSSAFKGGKLAETGSVGSGADNLFGHGFYTTDSEAIARSYTKKGAGRPTFTSMLRWAQDNGKVPNNTPASYDDVARLWDEGHQGAVYSVHWNGQGTPNLLDLDKPASETVRSWIDQQIHAPTFGVSGETLSDLEAKLGDPKSTGADLIRMFRKALGEGDITKSEADETMAALEYTLSTQGYDGLKHVGGIYRKGASTQHNVHIFFNNEDLRVEPSATTRPSVNKELPGSIGLQKATSVTSTDILKAGTGKLAQFQRQLAAIAPDDGKAKSEFVDSVIDYLHKNFNLDAVRLQVLGRNPNRLLEVLAERAKSLASDVMPTWDQPQWVRDKIDAINAKGYKIVVGSHIGHAYDGTLPDLGPIDGHLTVLRKWVGKMGLDPGRVPDVQVSQALRNSIMSKLHAVIRDDPKVKLTTPHADVRTVMAVMHHGVDREMPPAARGVYNLTSNVGVRADVAGAKIDLQTLNRTEIERLARTKYDNQPNAVMKARQDIEHSMAAATGLRDTSHKAMLQALTTDHTVELPSGATFNWNRVDEYTANRLIDAVNQGYRLPGYIMGWQALENWGRAGFRVGKYDFTRDQPLWRQTAQWTNRLVQARNAARFTMSPIFAARKTFKQNYKMSLELGRPVNIWNPLLDLEKHGEVDQAQKLLGSISGLKVGSELEADLYLRARDIYGLYSPQWTSAWFLNELSKRGDTPEQMKEAYDRVFKYGAHGGQTAVERTANTIFFPFSFEKSLLRNTGAYLADKPGQALLLDAGVEAFRQADQNGQIGQWVQDHLPILTELQLLNGFAHGISPGQLGGINAPLLNMFLPQMWGAPAHNTVNMKRFIPLWNELGALMKNTQEQVNIGRAAVHDTVRSVLKHNWKPEPTLVPKAQISYAVRTKAHLVNDPGVKSIIDYNSKQSSDADKYLWPQDKRLPDTIWGHPIDKTTIGQYVQYLYPAYDPNSGAAYAKNQAVALDSFIRKVGESDPAKGAQMKAFQQVADQVVSHLNRNDYDTPTAAAAQAQFQALAPKLNADPQWKALYNNFYAWALGPIQTPAQKAGAK